MPSLSYLGGLQLGNVRIPVLKGSTLIWDPAINRESPATIGDAPIGYTSTLLTPRIYARAYADDSWFNGSLIHALFDRIDYSLTSWISPCIFSSGNVSGQYYPAVKCNMMTLSWIVGRPVLVEMDLRPYGNRQFYSGGFSASTAQGLWPSSLVECSIPNVVSGRLTMSNQLVPNVSYPYLYSSDGFTYLIDYDSGYLDAAFEIITFSDTSYLVDTNSFGTLYNILTVMKSAVSSDNITFSFNGTSPSREEVISDGMALSKLTYTGIQPNSSSYVLEFY